MGLARGARELLLLSTESERPRLTTDVNSQSAWRREASELPFHSLSIESERPRLNILMLTRKGHEDGSWEGLLGLIAEWRDDWMDARRQGGPAEGDLFRNFTFKRGDGDQRFLSSKLASRRAARPSTS
jgi:hypothetical protein